MLVRTFSESDGESNQRAGSTTRKPEPCCARGHPRPTRSQRLQVRSCSATRGREQCNKQPARLSARVRGKAFADAVGASEADVAAALRRWRGDDTFDPSGKGYFHRLA
jgi:hypothetical protein